MTYTQHYASPLGGILLAADEDGLDGPVVRRGRNTSPAALPNRVCREARRLFCARPGAGSMSTFPGSEPDFTPPLHPVGSPFQQRGMGAAAGQFPMAKRRPTARLREQLAEKQGLTHMSAQAVGGAVGHNEISLIIPCHRVVGANGSLTGYAGGVDKKIKLLELERADMKSFFVPKKGTAL